MSSPCSPEQFAMAIAKHFVDKYEKVSKAIITVDQLGWERYKSGTEEHGHGFCMTEGYIRVAEVSYDDKGIVQYISGIFKFLKVS